MQRVISRLAGPVGARRSSRNEWLERRWCTAIINRLIITADTLVNCLVCMCGYLRERERGWAREGTQIEPLPCVRPQRGADKCCAWLCACLCSVVVIFFFPSKSRMRFVHVQQPANVNGYCNIFMSWHSSTYICCCIFFLNVFVAFISKEIRAQTVAIKAEVIVTQTVSGVDLLLLSALGSYMFTNRLINVAFVKCGGRWWQTAWKRFWFDWQPKPTNLTGATKMLSNSKAAANEWTFSNAEKRVMLLLGYLRFTII